MISKMVTPSKSIKKVTELTLFSREWLKNVKKGGKTVKWLGHLGNFFLNAKISYSS